MDSLKTQKKRKFWGMLLGASGMIAVAILYTVLQSGVSQQLVRSKFNPVMAADHPLNVWTSSGQKIWLNPQKQPILVFAYWCPHCKRTLQLFSVSKNQLPKWPILISSGFSKNTSLAQAIKLTHADLHAFHLKHLQVYYDLHGITSEYTKIGYPAMLFMYHHKLYQLNGEHTLAVWEKTLQGL